MASRREFLRAFLTLCLVGSVIPQSKHLIVASVSNVEEDDGQPIQLPIPEDADGMTADDIYYKGEALLMKGETMEAARYLSLAAKLMPNDAFSYGNLAISLHQMGRSREAAPHFRRAVSLSPVEVYFANLGQALWSTGEPESDVLGGECLPVLPEHVTCRATQIEESIRTLRTAVRMNPNGQIASQVLLAQLEHYTCSVLRSYEAGYGRTRRLLKRALELGEGEGGLGAIVWTPSQIVQLDVDEVDALRVCRIHTKHAASAVRPGISLPIPGAPYERSRLRLGYLSYSFGLGVRNGLMYNVFASHAKEKVEVFGFAIRPHDDGASEEEKRRVEANIEHFIDISQVAVEHGAAFINEHQVHVLVDICGLHANGTVVYSMLAHQPASVQVAYMAFAASTGADYIQMLVTDKVTTPPEYRHFYQESLLLMPASYHVNSHSMRFKDAPSPPSDASSLAAARVAAGLPSKGTIFCSYNQFFKFDLAILRAWSRLLAADHAASLLLVKFMFHEHAGPRLARLIAERGAMERQLIMADKTGTAEHIARSSLMDVHLDTRLQSGHTTTVDAIWSGIPVIVWPARSMVSRAAAGIVLSAGLSWAVARTEGDYVDLARRIARKAPSLKREIVGLRASSPLFDLVTWTREFERAAQLAFESRCTSGSGGCEPNARRMHIKVAKV